MSDVSASTTGSAGKEVGSESDPVLPREGPVVDAVVIAYHGDRWLRDCVQFVEAETGSGVRVVIGDNFGNDTVGSFVEGRRIVSVDLPGPLGFAQANNLTMVAVGLRSQFVCFLNQDTRSPPGWLQQAASFMSLNPDVGAMTPLVETYDRDGWDPNFVACAKVLGTDWEDRLSNRHGKEFHEVPEIPAPAMVVRTDVLRRIGGFDPIYGSYYEDYDLCRRIAQAGYRVGIWTGARVAHFSGSATRTPEEELRRQRLIVRNRLIYRVRYSSAGRFPQLLRELLGELPRNVARRVLGRPASKPLSVILGGYSDALMLTNRLVSPERDRRLWHDYLRRIGWPAN